MQRVLVVDRARFFGGDWPQGFVAVAPADRGELVASLIDAAWFLDRPVAEEDPSRKQLVPYCVIRRGDAVFCVERLPGEGERRLQGKLSIGLGGHVDEADGPIGPGILERALDRELHEELVLPAGLPEPRFVGLLNDDSNPVGAVHVGLVHVLEVPESVADDALEIREIHRLRGHFRVLAARSRLWQDAARFETWSSLLLDRLLARTDGSELSSRQGTPSRHGREESRDGRT